MKRKRLHDSLQELHSEIQQTPSHDSVSEEKLNDLLENVNNVLEHPADVSFDHHRNLMKSLKDSVEYFEISHPKLTGLISNVINSLNALGI